MTTSQNRIRRRFSDDLKRKLCQDQDYRCMYCGRKRAFSDLEIDHKKPVQREGSDNVRNLQVLCPPCNKRKGNQTDQEFRRRYRELLPKTKQPPECLPSGKTPSIWSQPRQTAPGPLKPTNHPGQQRKHRQSSNRSAYAGRWDFSPTPLSWNGQLQTAMNL